MTNEVVKATANHTAGIARRFTETPVSEGHFRIEVWRNGQLVDVREGKNTITNAGKQHLAGLFCGLPGYDPFRYIALGTGTTPPSENDTALESEITGGGGARALATCSRNDRTAVLTATWNVTSSFAITETGVFNASTGGVMYARAVFAALNLQNGDTLTFTWNIVMQ